MQKENPSVFFCVCAAFDPLIHLNHGGSDGVFRGGGGTQTNTENF